MRWLMTFLLGVLVGAGGLFVWLRQMPHDPAAPTVAVNTGALPAPPQQNSRIRFEIVMRLTQNRPLLDFAQMCVKPRLCRRHNLGYADLRVMPTSHGNSLSAAANGPMRSA